MDAVKLVKCIETLTIKDTIEILRVTTEDDEQIIGLPMFMSSKSGDGIKHINVTMLYIPAEQTVMNVIDLETSNASSCTIEPSGKHLIQPEIQCFWGIHKERIVELFNQKSQS